MHIPSIRTATYILIALHFARMVLRRVTPANTNGIPTAFTAPKGYHHKVVIFYRTADGTLRAMEYYTKTWRGCYDIYRNIRSCFSCIPENSVFYFDSYVNLPIALKTNIVEFPSIDSLMKDTVTLTVRQRMGIESAMYDIHNRCHLGSYYRNIIIC